MLSIFISMTQGALRVIGGLNKPGKNTQATDLLKAASEPVQLLN